MMRFVFPILALTGAAFAALDFSKWHPQGPNELRGPCPALNSLANHDFIPRNGRNLTIPLLVQVLGETLHVSPEFAATLAQLGLFTADDPSKGSFTLKDLLKHNLFEHDASLSRQDLFFAGREESKLTPKIFDKFIRSFKGAKTISLPAAAKARYAMIENSRRTNPNFTYEVQHQITSYGETVFYFRSMVHPETGLTPTEFVKILFLEERLPFNEGWRPPKAELSGFSLASDVLQLALHTNEKYPFKPNVGGKPGTSTTRVTFGHMGRLLGGGQFVQNEPVNVDEPEVSDA